MAVPIDRVPAAAERNRIPKTLAPNSSSARRYASRYRTPTLPYGRGTPKGAGRTGSEKSRRLPVRSSAVATSVRSSPQRGRGRRSSQANRATAPSSRVASARATSVPARKGSRGGSARNGGARRSISSAPAIAPPAAAAAARTATPSSRRAGAHEGSGSRSSDGRMARTRPAATTSAAAAPANRAAPSPVRPLARIIRERLQPSRGPFSAMRRHPSSAMRPGIAVVGLPCLTKKSLAGTRSIRAWSSPPSINSFGAVTSTCFGRVSANNPGSAETSRLSQWTGPSSTASASPASAASSTVHLS